MADKPSTRILGIDVLRGVAVLLMIEQHLGVWLWQGPAKGETVANYPGLLTFNALGGGAAPLFVSLAGMGSAMLLHKPGAKDLDLTIIRRGLVLMGFGYLLSFITPSWFTWRSWFVLHLMGAGMIMTPALRRMPTWSLYALALAVLTITPFFQEFLQTPSLSNQRMAAWAVAPKGDSPGVVIEGGHLRMALIEGHFPIFPWLAFFIVGFGTGRHLSGHTSKGEPPKLRYLLTTGAIALGLGGLLAALHYGLHIADDGVLLRATKVNVPFYPSSPSFILLLIGAIHLASSGTIALERKLQRGESKVRLTSSHPLVTLGRASLTLLLFHVWFFREISRPLGWWRSLTPAQTGAIMGGFCVLSIVLSWLWQKAQYRFGAEWLLRKLAP